MKNIAISFGKRVYEMFDKPSTYYMKTANDLDKFLEQEKEKVEIIKQRQEQLIVKAKEEMKKINLENRK
jgi:hypothetical protein